MIVFVLMNLILCASSFLLTYRILKFDNFIDSLIALFILYFSEIIIIELLLGIMGKLYLQNIIFLSLAILLIIWLISRTKESSLDFLGARKALFELLNNKFILLGTCVILGFGITKVFVNLVNPPFGWDSLNYHFTFPVEWMKNGNLNNPIVVSDDPFPTYYPINGSLLFLWLIFPFKSAFLADLGQLPFFVISFLAILSIGKKLGLGKEYSFFTACLFVTIPNFFKQLGIGYVDIMVGGIFLVALSFILSLKEKFNLKNIIIFAISFGIFIGIKTTVLTYSILILLPFLYLAFSQKQASITDKIGYAIIFFSLVLIFGCFSYFKNFILTGNPFYPLDVTILGKTIFRGVIDKMTFIARNEESGYSLAKLLFHEGLGVQSLLIILPGAILALPVNILRNKNKDLFLNYIITLPLLLYLTYRFILPIPNSRYLYPVLGIGMIVGFYVLSSLKMPPKIIRIIVIISIIVSAFECARRMELGISFALSFLLFIMFILFLKYKRPRINLLSKGGIISGILILLIVLQILLLDYKKNEYVRYVKNSRYWPDATSAWAWLNNNTEGNNIAYVGRPVPYPLYGTNFKNNVYYVSVNSFEPIHLHDLKNSRYSWDNKAENMHRSFEEPNNYRGNADYAVWLNNLHKRKTDFLFIYSLHHTKDIKFPIEEVWAKSHLDKFNLVFNNKTVRIYKLNKKVKQLLENKDNLTVGAGILIVAEKKIP